MENKLNGLDLFSGIAGISEALKPWVRTIAYCERERYAQAVLLSRMQSGDIDRAPIWDDVTTLHDEMLPRIDIIFGGFPCQDLSTAGRGAGLAGERSGLFFEIIRLAKETRAPFVFLENVPAIRTRGLRDVIRAFTEIGYDCRWTCLSASSVGAPHKRERWFLLAYLREVRCDSGGPEQSLSGTRKNGEIQSLANSDNGRFRNNSKEKNKSNADVASRSKDFIAGDYWSSEPNVGRVVNGLPLRVDRIKCLGNSVVPFQVQTAFKKLAGIK